MLSKNKNIKLASLLLGATLLLPACQTSQNNMADLQMQPPPEVLNQRGKSDFNNKKYIRALHSYEMALKANPQNHDARLGLAETYAKLKQEDKAFENYQTLLLEPTHEARALQGLGLMSLQNGYINQSQELLEKAVAGNANLWRGWNGLAQIYDIQKDWEMAGQAYESALMSSPKPHIIYNNIGISYMAQGLNDDAAKAFKKALQHKPSLQTAKTNYRLALAAGKNYDEAIIENDSVSEAKALNNVGYVAMLKGDYKEAERLFLKSIEVNPSFYKDAYSNLQVLHHLAYKG